MGQPINVIQKPSPTPGVLRFEINRSLTGMSKEIYRSVDDIVRDRPPDQLARRLFDAGGVDQVIVYGNLITLRADSANADAYQAVIEGLYLYYQPGDPYPEVTVE